MVAGDDGRVVGLTWGRGVHRPPVMVNAGSDGNAINAGTVCVAGIAGKACGDGVVSDARVEWVDEPVAGYPKRAVPTAAAPVRELRRRTLANLYNERPRWLVDAHGALDAAVAAAYAWKADISDDDALDELLKLNLARHDYTLPGLSWLDVGTSDSKVFRARTWSRV